MEWLYTLYNGKRGTHIAFAQRWAYKIEATSFGVNLKKFPTFIIKFKRQQALICWSISLTNLISWNISCYSATVAKSKEVGEAPDNADYNHIHNILASFSTRLTHNDEFLFLAKRKHKYKAK